MFEINIQFKHDGWAKRPWTVAPATMCEAVVLAIGGLDVAMNDMPYQLLPVGVGEFIIWAQGQCRGFMSIKEVGPATLAQGLEEGQ